MDRDASQIQVAGEDRSAIALAESLLPWLLSAAESYIEYLGDICSVCVFSLLCEKLQGRSVKV